MYQNRRDKNSFRFGQVASHTHTHSTHLCLYLGPGAYSGHLSPSTRFTPLAHYANHHQSKPNIIELKRKLLKCTSATFPRPFPPIISANPCAPLTVKKQSSLKLPLQTRPTRCQSISQSPKAARMRKRRGGREIEGDRARRDS